MSDEHRTGSMRDFRKPGQPTQPGPKILGQNEVIGPVTTSSVPPEGEPITIEVREHESVTHEGEGQVRSVKHDDGIEIRLREGASQSEWDKIKRGDD